VPSVVQNHATTDRGGIWVLDSGGLKEPCVRWGQIPTSIRPVVRVKWASPGHAWIYPVVDILKATQQGAALVQSSCRLECTRRGAR